MAVPSKKIKSLSVRLNGQPVGSLVHTAAGRMQFKYLPGVSRSISLSLPIRVEAYSHKSCQAYFAGLLPESSQAKRAIAIQFNANPNSVFSLLSVIGHDCAGAVSFMPPDAPVVEDAAVPFAVRRISDSELKRHILELAQKPLFIGVEGLKLSLAGVQEKAAVIVLDEEICLPLSGTPTSHILKPGNARFPALVQNEFLCMRAAVRMGLRVPAVQIRAAEDQLYLLVARYDREVGATILRIHQEDFCQALGRREKYQIFGGPNLKDCFELMMRSSLPVVDRRALMQAVIFNYLIGNSDAHGKNLSVIHVRPEFVRLAPLYDLVCTQIYPSVSRDMAMKIGKEYQFDRVSAGDWRKLAGDAGFSFPALRQLLQKYLSELPAAVEVERQALKGTRFDADELDAIVDFVRAHCAKTFNRLRDE